MRKRRLLKSLCSAFFVYVLTIVTVSIYYVNKKNVEKELIPDITSFAEDIEQNSFSFNNDDWKHVSGMIYVYSAFWEYRTNPTMVRIIGIGRTRQNYTSQLICLMKYADDIVVVAASFKNFEDNHDMGLSAKFFYCNAESKPEKVALITSASTSVSWLNVHDTGPDKNVSKNNIAVCTQPLYQNHERPVTSFNIAEFMAYYEIMGVSRFVFYDYKTDNSIKNFLYRLEQTGSLVEVMPWSFPKDSRSIWNAGQSASVADCVYRHASSYEYIATVDFDEYIVPSDNVTLQELLQKLTDINGSQWSSYMFRHTVFCLEHPNDPLTKNIALPFISQIKTSHGKIWDPYARAKSIIRPAAVVLPGIHYTWEVLPKWNVSLDVNPSLALLHHYRRYLCMEEKRKYVADRSAWRYRDGLLESKIIKLWRMM